MSLDVYLTDDAGNELFSANITHNLNKMATEAGIYMHLWRPEEIGITKARDLIDPVAAGLARMVVEPTRFKAFNPQNGWGSWEGFITWIAEYLEACRRYPDANVTVSR